MTLRLWIRPFNRLTAVALVAAVAAVSALQAQSISEQQTTVSLRRALNKLPEYGVFDFLAFSVERGTVTLVGYAYSGTLKRDAEAAVKRVAGVDEVANRLELLPASLNDDRIRQATFYKLYTDSFLSRYASGGALATHHEAIEFGRYPGRQPFGNYPIHIIVKHGRITLFGVVDNAGDRQLAEFKAREVSGAFSVTNELTIAEDRGR